MDIKVGLISAVNLAAGTVDVKFPDKVSTDLGLLECAIAINPQNLVADAPVVCVFPDGSGHGICLGRYYTEQFLPAGSVNFDKAVNIGGALGVSGDVSAVGNISAANFP